MHLPFLDSYAVQLFIKREDELHPHISGNKYRKLKYNLIKAKREKHATLLTYGGAFSNHILATACTGKENGFDTVGIIRGEELASHWHENPTLKMASDFGMRFHFVPRETYRKKSEPHFLEDLQQRFGDFYMLPEGGTNELAVKGCEEILTEGDTNFDVVCCSVGTGGTLAGLINSVKPDQKVLGYAALKGDFLTKSIQKYAQSKNWQLVTEYHFGGYAKVNEALVRFVNDFYAETGIPLDPIYTGKMLFGIFDQLKKGILKPQSNILVIHTGGLQGIKGMNLVLKKKNLPLLHI